MNKLSRRKQIKLLKEKEKEALTILKEAAAVFLSVNLPKQAAKCFFTGQDFKKAGEIYSSLSMWREAGDSYYLLEDYKRAAENFEKVGDILRILDCYENSNDWVGLLDSLYKNRSGLPEVEYQNFVKKFLPLALEDLVKEVDLEINYEPNVSIFKNFDI